MIRPQKSPWLQRGFRLYNRRYLRQNFHGVHLEGDFEWLRGDGETPLLVCVNHSSWWDLLMGVLLDEYMTGWDCYVPMDQRQLDRYRFFSKLGVIGVDRTSLQGAREFVSYCQELLEGQPRSLWITPQGAFVSNEVRPVHFQPGIGAVAGSLSQFLVTTAVFDYEFWSERKPEAFISVRPPKRVVVGSDFDRRLFVQEMEQEMEAHLDACALVRQKRDASLFTPLLAGSSAIAPLYDMVRTLRAKARGEQVVLGHGEVVTPQWNPTERQKPR